jgi:protein SDA1
VNAAKSLINYFRDVCPQLLPKKFRGRFTNGEDVEKKEDMVFGRQKLNYDVDGVELLAKHEGYENAESLTLSRVLTDEDFKKIKRLKMKEALKHVIKDKEEKKKDNDDEDDIDEDDDDEEGEDDIDEDDLEEDSELEIDEGDIEEGDELQDDSDIDDEDGDDDEEREEEDEDEEDDDQEEGEEESDDDNEADQSDEELSQSESDDDDIDISEVPSSESEADNPHGFVYARNLDTFKKTKKEKIEMQKKEREETRDDRK